MKCTFSQTWTKAKRLHYRRAYTLTEIAIVLAVIGSLVAAIWNVTADVMQNKNVAIANRELTAIVGNLRATYAEQAGIADGDVTYGSDSNGVTLTTRLDQQRVFPMEMRGGAYGTLFHSWNTTPAAPFAGNVGVTAAGCAASGPTSAISIEACFGVIFENLSQNACVQFLSNAIAAGTGLQAIFVGNPTPATNIGTVAPDIGTINTYCAAVPNNAIEWVYTLKDNGS